MFYGASLMFPVWTRAGSFMMIRHSENYGHNTEETPQYVVKTGNNNVGLMTLYSLHWIFRDEMLHLDIDIMPHAMTALNEASFFIHLNNPYFVPPLTE